MSKSETKKKIKALRERVETVEMNEDLMRRALSEDSWKETVKCKDEIKALLGAYDKQMELNRYMNKRIVKQRNLIGALQRKDRKYEASI